jgi:hypothetical protein
MSQLKNLPLGYPIHTMNLNETRHACESNQLEENPTEHWTRSKHLTLITSSFPEDLAEYPTKNLTPNRIEAEHIRDTLDPEQVSPNA